VAGDGANDRHNDVAHKRGYDCAESCADDHADGKIDHVTP
jgi:hypothetical protein